MYSFVDLLGEEHVFKDGQLSVDVATDVKSGEITHYYAVLFNEYHEIDSETYNVLENL